MSIRDGVQSGMQLANDFADISNIRNSVYKTKKEIIRSPLVRELIEVTFTSSIIPKRIQINSGGIFAQIYDENSGTYHPTGVYLYSPDVNFNYIFSAALASIFQDLYPEAYEMNKLYISQLSEMLENDTWFCELTLKEEFMYKEIVPAFDVSKINEIPLDSPIFKMSDKYTSKAPRLSKLSFTFGIVGLVVSLIPVSSFLGTFLNFINIFVGFAGFRSAPKGEKSLAVWGIILSVIGLLAPMVIGFLSFKAFLGI